MVIRYIFWIILLSNLFCCAIYDVRYRRIPNRLVAAGLAAGILCGYVQTGIQGITMAAGGILLPMLVFFPLYAIRMFGAGDVKLLAVVGGFFGIREVPVCFLFIFLFGAAAGLLRMLRHRSLLRRLMNLREYIFECAAGRVERYQINGCKDEVLIPFAVPVLIGTAAAVLVQIYWN